MKSKGTAYILLAVSIFGICGLHRFYIGKIGTGVLYLFTCGLFGFGLLYDLFTLGKQVDMANLLINGRAGINQNVNTNNNVNTQNQNVVVNVVLPTEVKKENE